MDKYTFINYLDLVSSWYNEFLPSVAEDNMLFVKEAGVVYLNSVSLEPKKVASVRFLASKLMEIGSGIKVVVQEPRPIHNPRLQSFLRFVETSSSIGKENKEKLFHLANQRYVASSDFVMFSQDREIVDFLDKAFIVLSKLNLPNSRFYCSESLTFKDVANVAISFFPSKALSIHQANRDGLNIKVDSTNDVLASISSKIYNGSEAKEEKFIDLAKAAVMKDIEEKII